LHCQMAYVRVGPYSALRLTAAYRGSPLDAYVLAPVERVAYRSRRLSLDADDDMFAGCSAKLSVTAPVYYDLRQVLGVLSKEDAANADRCSDDALFVRAKKDPASLAHGGRLY